MWCRCWESIHWGRGISGCIERGYTGTALLRTYKEFEERVGAKERGRRATGDRVRAEIMKCHLLFSISELENACPGISRDIVRVVLWCCAT